MRDRSSEIIKVGNWHVLSCDTSVHGRDICHWPKEKVIWQNKKTPDQIYRGADLLSFIRAHTKHRGGIYVDCGASYGFTSYPLASNFRTVYSFEPFKPVFDCLQLNTNDAQNIHCFNFALSNELKTEQAIFRPTNTMISSLSETPRDAIAQRPDHPQFEHHTVTSIALDSMIKRPVNVIKVDVEGSELKLLQGASNLLTMSTALVIVEQLDHNNNDVELLMRDHGYHLTDVMFMNDFVYKKTRL